MKDLQTLFLEAGRLHGHFCPGLASGVRAAAAAAEILGVEPENHRDLYCIAEKTGCYIDGIQMCFNTTLGKGNLILHDTGKAAFSFYDALSGKSVRLVMLKGNSALPNDVLIERALTAPIDELFVIGEVRLPCPVRAAQEPYGQCAVCGEETQADKLIEAGGRLICADCAAFR